MTLITDPNHAKAALEIDPNSPATKRDVSVYVQNFWNDQIKAITDQQRAAVNQQNGIAILVNFLMDYLCEVGLGNSNHGRYKLNRQEFAEFVRDKQQKQVNGAKVANSVPN